VSGAWKKGEWGNLSGKAQEMVPSHWQTSALGVSPGRQVFHSTGDPSFATTHSQRGRTGNGSESGASWVRRTLVSAELAG
jgi:hypothetical protein